VDSLTIDWFSDVACPFCAIGRRQLDLALETLGYDDTVIRIRAFELDPAAPASYGRSMTELVGSKYGLEHDQVERFHEKLAADAAELGLTLRFDLVQGGNTFDAHRLTAWASTQGLGPALAKALQEAYFADGLSPSDHAGLAEIASAIGLDPIEASEVLRSDQCTDVVRREERTAHALGFTGVPTALINGRVLVSGAQGVDAFLAGIEAGLAAAPA
jgi:predicted DsbA family dithiol-disulfide isomerase